MGMDSGKQGIAFVFFSYFPFLHHSTHPPPHTFHCSLIRLLLPLDAPPIMPVLEFPAFRFPFLVVSRFRPLSLFFSPVCLYVLPRPPP